MIYWAQLANSITMISPFVSWLYHRRKSRILRKHTTLHVSRLMIVHIPISVLYHGFAAFGIMKPVYGVLKAADLSLIHLHAMVVARLLWGKQRVDYNHGQKHAGQYHAMMCILRASETLNILSIYKICRAKENILMRLCSLYLSGACTLPMEKKCSEVAMVGLISSSLYALDDRLKNTGHAMFHIVLGYLHHITISML